MNKACTSCQKKDAVTKDGRDLCLTCLQRIIRQLTPIPGEFVKRTRTVDHKQDPSKDITPWQEDAIKALEESSE